MNQQTCIDQVAMRFGSLINKPDSPAIRKILCCAMSEEEAGFLLALPAPVAELAARYGMSEQAIEARLLALAKRGLVVSSRKGPRLPGDLTTLHDSIMASAPEHIPPGIGAFWRELYDGEDWAADIGHFLSQFPMTPIRTIPVLDSVAREVTPLAAHEDIEAIIRANAELISIRECCCRNAARKCDHPNDVCMQFGRRAKYDLYRGSGRQVTADEAIAIARRAGESGLVPTVTNMADVKALEFICFCCGCCCLIINPGLHTGKLDKILAPSRFVATINECSGCELCLPQCCVDAIRMDSDDANTKVATIDQSRCLGCGACVTACELSSPISMSEVRPPEFIPEKFIGSSVLGGGGPMGS